MQIFELPFRLPGLNEYQRACRASPFLGARMKKENMYKVQTHLGNLKPFKWPVNIEMFFIEPNQKRDKDNVLSFGAKVINDAMVKQGLLPDDNSDYIKMMNLQVLSDGGTAKIIVRVIEHDDHDFVGDSTDQTWAYLDKITNGAVSKSTKTDAVKATAKKRDERVDRKGREQLNLL